MGLPVAWEAAACKAVENDSIFLSNRNPALARKLEYFFYLSRLGFTRDVNLATRTMETEIDVENKDLSLTPGEYANTTIELERHNNVLTIPVQAVVRNGNQESVLVVDASHHVQTRKVVTGLQGSNLVEVKSGLAEGDLVITGGQSNYEPGEMVTTSLHKTSATDVSQAQSGGEQ